MRGGRGGERERRGGGERRGGEGGRGERRGGGRRGGGGGGGGGGMPEEEIKAVLARREQLRNARDFAGADALREELWEAGVRVDDKAREWRCKASGRSGRFELHSRKRGEGEAGNPNRQY